MIEEYDVVKATKELSGKVASNTTGTVLIIYEDTPKAFEVEFLSKSGETIETLTVVEGDIIKV